MLIEWMALPDYIILTSFIESRWTHFRSLHFHIMELNADDELQYMKMKYETSFYYYIYIYSSSSSSHIVVKQLLFGLKEAILITLGKRYLVWLIGHFHELFFATPCTRSDIQALHGLRYIQKIGAFAPPRKEKLFLKAFL